MFALTDAGRALAAIRLGAVITAAVVALMVRLPR